MKRGWDVPVLSGFHRPSWSWTFFRCRPKFPLCVNVFWQYSHVNGLCPVCLRKWSLRLHDFLKMEPQPSYRQRKYSLMRCVYLLRTLIVWCKLLGIFSKVRDWHGPTDTICWPANISSRLYMCPWPQFTSEESSLSASFGGS